MNKLQRLPKLRMESKLLEAAVSLEERMHASPLHRIHAAYTIGGGCGDPTVANFFFRNRPHMEKAKRLEIAFAADLISMRQFCDEFPNVLFVAVNAHYSVFGFPEVETFVSEGVSLVRPDFEDCLTEMTIELCRGVKVTYIPDDGKFRSDVVLGVTVARSGTVSDVYRTNYTPPFSFRSGTGILDVFTRMERYVLTNGRAF